MTGGRLLLVLGTILAAAVAAGVFLFVADPGDAPAPRPADGAAAGASDPARPQKDPKKGAARRPAKVGGTSVVTGTVRRRDAAGGAQGQTVTLSREGSEAWTAETGDDGSFRIPDLADGGPYELRVESKGFATVRVPGIILTRGETFDAGTVWLDVAVRVEVSVRTLADAPVEGADVQAFVAPDVARGGAADAAKQRALLVAEPVPVAKAVTGADGRAVFPELASGVWTFVARKPGLARDGRANVRLVGGEPAPDVQIWLATGASLSGRVLDGQKQAIAGALVLASRNQNLWDPAAASLRARATTDAEGRFRLDDLPPGDVALLVGRKGAIPHQAGVVRVPNVTNFVVYVRDGGRLEGDVTDIATGQPIRDVLVRVQAGGRLAEATTDDSGKYVADPVPDGQIGAVSAVKDGWIQDYSEEPQGGRQMQIQAGDSARRNLKMRRAVVVSGTVRGPSGPVSGASVVVWTSDSIRGVQGTRAVVTDAEGKFTIPDASRGRAVLQATKQGLVRRDFPENVYTMLQQGNVPPQFAVEIPDTGLANAEVVLDAGSRVEGRVESVAGPVAGVAVTGWMQSGATTTAKSGTDGSFALDGVTPGGKITLVAIKEGWISLPLEPVSVAQEGPTQGAVIRMARSIVVRGKVTSAAGEALRDAQVTASARNPSRGDMPYEMPVATGRQGAQMVPVRADGSYELPVAVATGTVVVRATAAGHAAGESAPVQVSEGSTEYEANVSLEPGYSIRGRVVAKGAPVDGASVTLYGGRSEGTGSVVAVTDAEGSFAVEHLSASQFTLNVTAEGYVARQQTQVKLPGSGDVTIEMDPALEIAGRATFADGTPIVGVQIYAQRENQEATRSRWGRGGGASAITGADGSFRVRNLAPGDYRLNLQPSWDGSVNVRPRVTDPVSAGTTDAKVIADTGGVIAGVVVDAAKRPVAGAQISANPTKQDAGNQWRWARTKPDGTFEIAGLGDSPYQLSVQPPASAEGAALLPGTIASVAPGTRDVTVVLEEGLRIAGVISNAAGKPLANAQLWIQGKPDDKGRAPEINGNNSWTTTDARGAFRFVGLSPGRYTVALANWGGSPHDGMLLQNGEDVAAGSVDLRIVAVDGERIGGVVVDEGGQAVAGAWVNAWGGQPQVHRNARTGPEGRFEVTGLPRSPVQVSAQAAGRPQVSVENVDAGTMTLRIVMPKGATITGRVSDASGTVMAWANLQFRQTEGGKHQAWAQSGQDGTFKAEALLEGTYEITMWRARADGSGEMVKLGTARTGDYAELRAP